MRRLLVVLCVASAAVGMASQAKAVTTSCADPIDVVGPVALATIGVDTTTDTTRPTDRQEAQATVCITEWMGTRYDVHGGVLSFLYGTDGQGGGWIGLCDRFGSAYSCTTVGALWNGGVWTSPDVVSMKLTPSVCNTRSGASYEHCFLVPIDLVVDGPLGPRTGVGAGACVAESSELGSKCLVGAGHFEDLTDERQRVYRVLETITAARAGAY